MKESNKILTTAAVLAEAATLVSPAVVSAFDNSYSQDQLSARKQWEDNFVLSTDNQSDLSDSPEQQQHPYLGLYSETFPGITEDLSDPENYANLKKELLFLNLIAGTYEASDKSEDALMTVFTSQTPDGETKIGVVRGQLAPTDTPDIMHIVGQVIFFTELNGSPTPVTFDIADPKSSFGITLDSEGDFDTMFWASGLQTWLGLELNKNGSISYSDIEQASIKLPKVFVLPKSEEQKLLNLAHGVLGDNPGQESVSPEVPPTPNPYILVSNEVAAAPEYFDLAEYEYQPGDENLFKVEPREDGEGWDVYGPDGKQIYIRGFGTQLGEIKINGSYTGKEGNVEYFIPVVYLNGSQNKEKRIPHFQDPSQEFTQKGIELNMLAISRHGAPVIITTLIPYEIWFRDELVFNKDYEDVGYAETFSSTNQSWRNRLSKDVFAEIQEAREDKYTALLVGFMNSYTDGGLTEYFGDCNSNEFCQALISSNHSGLLTTNQLIDELNNAQTPKHLEIDDTLRSFIPRYKQ